MTNSADPDQFQKPTDLDLHCLLKQGMWCSAREGLILLFIKTDNMFINFLTLNSQMVQIQIGECYAHPGLHS